jgi:hypothetical protein
MAAVITERPAAADPGAIGGNNAQNNVGNREAAIVAGDGFSGPLHPFHYVFFGGVELAFFHCDVDSGVSDEDGGGHGVSRIRASDEEKNKWAQDGERWRPVSKTKTFLILAHCDPPGINDVHGDVQ